MVCIIPLLQICHGAPTTGAPEEMSLRTQARVPVSSMTSGIFLAVPDGQEEPSAVAPREAEVKRNPSMLRPVSADAGRVVVFHEFGRSPSVGTKQYRSLASGGPLVENRQTW